jgi:hypothetical protein
MRTTPRLLFLLATLAACPAYAADTPRGIYTLSVARDNPNTAADERLNNIRSTSFVSGYTLRLFWADIETAQGVYDFSVIDAAIQRLAPIGQHLSIEVLNGVEPAYVLNSGASTYVDHSGQTNVVPWDAFQQSRYTALMDAMANHVVADGSQLPLAAHPVLASVDATPAGLNFGVRDLNGAIRSHPEYTRQRYVDAVVNGTLANRSRFPGKQGFLAYFSFNDGANSPSADTTLIAALDSAFNGSTDPSLAFFIENLSDTGPQATGNVGRNLTTWSTLGGDSMMQALDGWVAHTPDREPQLASHNAATGLKLGAVTFGTRFFELYVSDIDAASAGGLDAAGRPLLTDFEFWADYLASEPIPGDATLDGTVNFDDLLRLAASYNQSDPTPIAWAHGDFDWNGRIDFDDLLVLAAHYNTSGASAGMATLTVPEPIGLLALPATGVMLRRRRK